MHTNLPVVLIRPLLGAFGGSQMHQNSPNYLQKPPPQSGGTTPFQIYSHGGPSALRASGPPASALGASGCPVFVARFFVANKVK